jgi:hypothetical protein
MKRYVVTIPLTGIVSVEVDAEDEEGAKEKAWEQNISIDNIETWELTNIICRGNVLDAVQNEIEVEEIEAP